MCSYLGFQNMVGTFSAMLGSPKITRAVPTAPLLQPMNDSDTVLSVYVEPWLLP